MGMQAREWKYCVRGCLDSCAGCMRLALRLAGTAGTASANCMHTWKGVSLGLFCACSSPKHAFTRVQREGLRDHLNRPLAMHISLMGLGKHAERSY